MGPLSNVLNKKGICQEIDFKRSDYLKCSIRHTNQSRYSARLVGLLALASMVRATSDHRFSIGYLS